MEQEGKLPHSNQTPIDEFITDDASPEDILGGIAFDFKD
jgi:hypothetical protein